jgi:hypothetical protein
MSDRAPIIAKSPFQWYFKRTQIMIMRITMYPITLIPPDLVTGFVSSGKDSESLDVFLSEFFILMNYNRDHFAAEIKNDINS